MSVIFSRAPLRVSLGGGGTDLPSYYRQHGGFLVSGAIDKYVYMLTHTVFQRRYRMKYSQFEEVDDPSEIRASDPARVAAAALERRSARGERVADVPAGTGLGSSGSFTVCFLKALALARRVAITPGVSRRTPARSRSTSSASRPASRTSTSPRTAGSARTRSTPTARSTSSRSRCRAETLDRLRNNLLLFYTGEARAASAILADQVDAHGERDDEMLRQSRPDEGRSASRAGRSSSG